MKINRTLMVAVVALLVCGLGVGQASVWDGGGSDNNFSTSANWDPDGMVTNGDSLIFAGINRLTPTNDFTNYSFAGITFNTNAGAFNISGNAFTLTNNIVNNSANTQTISAAGVTLSNLAVTVNAASNDISITAPIGGSAGLTKTGAFTLTLTGSGGGVQATGGNTTNDIGGYRIHTFTSGGNFVVTAGGTVEYLVVGGGGGGGGGYQGGGGGAGGYLTSLSHAVTPQTYSITVGAGGDGCKNSPDVVATNGGNSVFDTVTAVGGGRGGSEAPSAAPNTGGSGGGGSWDGTTQNTGAAGTAGPPIQGYAGGNGYAISPYGNNNFPGGGGGGSAGVGTNGVNIVAQTDGGPGTSSSISGSPVTYAAGGKGANRSRGANGANASANTGNGGEAGGNSDGGGNSTGGNGGSGIVIIRYLSSGGNTYTGATTVAAGTLALTGNGAIGSSAVTVSGGTFAPGGVGAGDATNATGAFTMQSGGTLHFDLSAPQTPPTAGGDQIQVAGNITLAGTLTVNNLGSMAEGMYTLMTYTGTASGSFATTNMPVGFNGSVSVDTGNKRVNLVVTPSVTVPTVNNANGATNVTQTTACLNGSVTSTGGVPTTAYIYWGATDGGTSAASWANSVNMGIQGGSFTTTVTGLTVNTTYYYRCYATNSAGSAWAATSTNFTTQILNGPVFRIW